MRLARPGSVRTRWGSFSAPPDPLAAIGGGAVLLRGREGRNRERERGGMERRKGKGRGEGKERGCLLFM